MCTFDLQNHNKFREGVKGPWSLRLDADKFHIPRWIWQSLHASLSQGATTIIFIKRKGWIFYLSPAIEENYDLWKNCHESNIVKMLNFKSNLNVFAIWTLSTQLAIETKTRNKFRIIWSFIWRKENSKSFETNEIYPMGSFWGTMTYE